MMRRKWVGLAFVSLSGAVAGFVGCVGDDPVELTPSDEAGTPTPGNKKDNGTTCGAGDECNSGQCVDGVCCESSCAGTCESCNLPGSVGKCAAIAAGQDPAKECKRLDPIVEDAGADPGDGGDGGDDAAASADAGSGGLNVPDGGLVGEEGPCAPSCNGQRACGYPAAETTCGTTFCNDTKQAGRLACDGRGNCAAITLDTCQAYTCGATDTSGACKTACVSTTDCQDTHYCSAAGKCEPKKGTGVPCSLPTDCQTGYCAGTAGASVCCESECTGASTSCTSAGNVGKCVCPACATGPCKLYYKDADGDGYGNRDGKVDDNTAKYGCASGPAPIGYVDNNKDCYDVADLNGPKVRPNQTEYFDVGYGPTGDNYDYNCDGVRTEYYKEYPGTVCHYCNSQLSTGGGGGSACTEPTTCSSSNLSVTAGHSCFGGSGPLIAFCNESVPTAFRKSMECGDPAATLYTCGKCSGTSTAPSVSTTTAKQKCH
jgi:hypothetical protein